MRRSNPITTQRIVQLKGKYGVAALPAITARVAREELAKVMAEAPAPYRQFVDGAEGAPLEHVRPGGVIMFKFSRIAPVIDWIYEELLRRSPVGPDKGGHYRDDHWLFVNGEKVDVPELERTAVIKPGSEIIIIDARPYARKIEAGASLQAPDGVYELTATAARNRFPFAEIAFGYRPALAGAQRLLSTSHRSEHHRAAAKKADNRYPAIIIKAGG